MVVILFLGILIFSYVMLFILEKNMEKKDPILVYKYEKSKETTLKILSFLSRVDETKEQIKLNKRTNNNFAQFGNDIGVGHSWKI